jgi:hypothetical protein
MLICNFKKYFWQFELKASFLPGGCSTTWPILLAIFALVFGESHFLLMPPWTMIYFMLPAVAWMTGVCCHAQLLVGMRSCKFLLKLAWNTMLLISVSQGAKITVRHLCLT